MFHSYQMGVADILTDFNGTCNVMEQDIENVLF